MNQMFRFLRWSALAILLIALTAPASGQVNVTFRVNTSTNLDTLSENHFVEMRGALNGTAPNTLPDGNTINWDASSTLELTNVGGDYWEITFQMNPDDTLNYKFWSGFDDATGTVPDGGWEGPFNPSNGIQTDTRTFISTANDSVLDLQYYHPNTGEAVDQYFRPFETKADSVAIYFRVNMAGLEEADEFDPATNGPVGVRGNDQTSGGVLDWGATDVLLTPETASDPNNERFFYSGYAYLPVDSLAEGTAQAYKFFIENPGSRSSWEEGISDRMFTYTPTFLTQGDTTLHWTYFENRAPVGMEPVDVTLTFRVSTEALEGLGLFDRGLGDEIKVIGPKGWDVTVGTETSFLDMNFIPALQEWTVAEPFTMIPGTEITYKYFVRWDSTRVDSTSDNFIPNLKIRGINDDAEDSGWEEPAVTGGEDRSYTFTANASQETPGDFGFDRAFFNSVPANGVIDTPISITWNVDMTPATDPASNTNTNLFDPAVDSVWIRWDGSLLALAKGFETFGERDLLLEDPDGDMTYTFTWELDPPAWYQLPFILEYGNATDGYITNGGGTTLGRRYYQFIVPEEIQNDLTTVWPSEVNLPVIEWKQDDLPFQEPPDLTQPTSVAEEDGTLPLDFDLAQNYPNPFNPETTIRYQVATATDVKIEVYNVMGQLVKTLVNEKQEAGTYTVKWLGNNTNGLPVSSGVYFLKMRAADFNKVQKMALVR